MSVPARSTALPYDSHRHQKRTSRSADEAGLLVSFAYIREVYVQGGTKKERDKKEGISTGGDRKWGREGKMPAKVSHAMPAAHDLLWRAEFLPVP